MLYRLIFYCGTLILFAQLNSFCAYNFRSLLTSKGKRYLQQQSNSVVKSPAAFYEAPDNTVMTLSRFMIEATRSNPDHADMESLVESLQIGCKGIANLLSRNGVSDLYSKRDEIKKPSSSNQMYQSASSILKNALRFTGKVGVIAFENEDQPVLVDEAWNSKYIALFDPLDGSSNIDVGGVTGTIFGIFQEDDECLNDSGEMVSTEGKARLLANLKPNKNLVAAGYCMYSSSTVFVLSLGDGKFYSYLLVFR
jgi:fructose-1,6-bisphosphatase I